ncbi:MAG: ABC transporter substrate-binding protein [Anaerolineae bacterium]|nr:MAG: ABC transporter substrate-binding protein [Anaerolineae bacterium]
MNRLLVRALTIVVLSGMVLAGCGPAAAPDEPTEVPSVPEEPSVPTEVSLDPTAIPATDIPPVEQNLRLAVLAVAETLDGLDQAQNSVRIEYQIYEPLARTGMDANLEPVLAVSWEALDATTWQLKLREGVTFHNGEEFDADSVKFSFDYVLDPDNNVRRAGWIKMIKDVQVVDKFTVNIITDGPSGLVIPALWNVNIRPAKYFAEVGAEGFAQAPVGTGPFKVVEFSQDERVVLERYDDYWGGAPLLDTVEFIEMPEQSTRMAALEAGEVDIAQDVALDQVPRLQDAGLETLSVVTTSTPTILIMNPKQADEIPALSDQRVRQALNYAVDKAAIVDSLMGGLGRVTQSQFVTPDGFGFDRDLDPYPYDPAMATQLLSDAGVDGLTFTVYYPANRYPYGDQILEIVASYWAAIGVNVELVPMDAAEWGPKLRGGELASTLFGPGAGATGDLNDVLSAFHSTHPFGWMNDPELDALIDAERITLDPDKRTEVLHEASAYLAELAPVVWSVWPPQTFAFRTGLHEIGFSPNILELRTAYTE